MRTRLGGGAAPARAEARDIEPAPPGAADGRPGGRLGVRAHLIALGILALAAIAVAGVWLTSESRRYAATNSAAPRGFITSVPAGRRLCVTHLFMPAGSDDVRLWLGTMGQGESRVALSVSTPEGPRTSSALVTAAQGQKLDFPVRPLGRSAPVSVCLSPNRALVGVGGVPYIVDSIFGRVAYQDGKAIDGRPSVWFMQPHRTSLASALPDAVRRAALFRPGFVGPWTYVVLLLLLPLLWFAGLRTLIRGGQGSRPRGRLSFPKPALVVVLVTFANAVVWALVTPAFQGPDEQAHVAYAAQLAETGTTPTPGSTKPFFSSEMVLALEATHHYSVIQFPQARPPWRAADEHVFDRLARRHPARGNGGGDSVAAVHGPVYYAFPALAYRIAGGSFFGRLFAMRVASALLAALTALFVYGTVRELLPRQRWAAVAAGLAVGFEPMFGFISGTVNADVGVNLAGAALLYLLVRALRRGMSAGLAAAISVTFVLGVLAKATMLAFAPVVAVALAMVAWSRRPTLKAWATLAATFAVSVLAWAALANALDRSLLPLPREAGPGSAGVGIRGTLSYLWQVFFPPLPFMHDIYQGPSVVPAWLVYIERTWGTFGWVAINFPNWVFDLIGIATGLAVLLAIRAAVRYRAAIRARAAELAVLGLGFACVALLAHLAFVHVTPSRYVYEQGRYLFPAITTTAVAAVCACYGLGRRLAPLGATVLVGAIMLLSAFAQLFVLVSYYT